MRNKIFTTFTLMCAVFVLLAANAAKSQTPRFGSTRQVQRLLSSIESKTRGFRRDVEAADRNSVTITNREERFSNLMTDFESATQTFRARFDSRQSVDTELADLLNQASRINRFMERNPLNTRSQTEWISLRTDLNTLARYYGNTWSWNQQPVTTVVPTYVPPYSSTDAQLRDLIARIERETNIYKRQMASATDRGRISDVYDNSTINNYVSDFEMATNRLRDQFNSRQSTSADATDVLTRARVIDQFMTTNRTASTRAPQWSSLRNDLNTLASYYNMSWNWNDQITPYPTYVPPYSSTDAQLRDLIARIENETNVYKRQMAYATARGRISDTYDNSTIDNYVSEFEMATNRLRDHIGSRQSTSADVSDVLSRARVIDQIMATNRTAASRAPQWSSLRNDLDTLATYYNVSWNWNEQITPYPNPNNNFPAGGRAFDARMTGTYRLNTRRSDDVTAVVDRTVRSYTADERDRVRQNLERRLRSPDVIAIEKNRSMVSIGSSNSPQISFEADGIAKTETNDRGRIVTTTATADSNGLTINYEGERMNDFYVTFTPGRNDELKVTRRIYIGDKNQQVTVSSVYDKINTVAEWPPVTNGPAYGYGNNTTGVNDFYIPNGTQMTTTLRSMINTNASQPGDRFTMDVISPSRYRGAVIEGRVVDAGNSGRVSGRANISLDFDTITLNGRTYRFAGIVDGATAANGDTVTVNNEGVIRDNNQATNTAARAGIGAVLGAIIGAVAGGGEGAAIGAGVGAGVGAGSVLVAGRDNLVLDTGSTFNITSTGPRNVGVVRY